jgi:hypothetical protein
MSEPPLTGGCPCGGVRFELTEPPPRRPGIPASDVTLVMVEAPRENWGVQGGQPASEVELGFAVEV